MKTCSHCGLPKDLSEFHKNKNLPGGRASWCKLCVSEYNEQYKLAYPEKEEARKLAGKRQRKDCKAKVFAHYGSCCACCGEDNMMFLTVDHVDNDGAEHRRTMTHGSTISVWLVKHNFPEGFQILCYNCSCGRAHNGGVCPHQEG